MSYPDDTSGSGASSSVLGLLRGLVSSDRQKKKSRSESSEALRSFLATGADEKSTQDAAQGPSVSSDPAREAAMNRIRRLRIHAA